MSSPLRSFLFRVLLGAVLLPCAPSLLAQTHLGVPAKQLVEIRFFPTSADPTGAYSYLDLNKADGTIVNNWTIPAGQALVLLDFHVKGVQFANSSGAVNNSLRIIRKYAANPNWVGPLATIPVTIPLHPGGNCSFEANLSLASGLVFTSAAPPAVLPEITGSTSYWFNATGYLTTY